MGFQRTHYWTLKSKMAEIRHFENRHDVIFSAEGGTIWIKFCRLVQNDMSTAMIWSKSKPDVFFFGFFIVVWALMSGGFRIVSDTLAST